MVSPWLLQHQIQQGILHSTAIRHGFIQRKLIFRRCTKSLGHHGCAGRIIGPLLAGTARLVVVAIGGFILVKTQAPPWTLFAVVALGMVVMGTATAAAVALTPWGPRPIRM